MAQYTETGCVITCIRCVEMKLKLKNFITVIVNMFYETKFSLTH